MSPSPENQLIIQEEVDASSDPYTNGYIKEIEDSPFFKDGEENGSKYDARECCQIERDELANQTPAY